MKLKTFFGVLALLSLVFYRPAKAGVLPSMTSRNDSDTSYPVPTQPTIVITGTARAGTVAVPAESTKIRRRGRKNSGRERKNHFDEMDQVAFQIIKKTEESKSECRYDQFFDYNKQSCEFCDKYCAGDEKYGTCGLQCIVYFENVALRRTDNWLIACLAVASTIAIACFCCFWWQKKRIGRIQQQLEKALDQLSGIQDRNRGKPNGDETEKGTTESEESLLSNATEESGEAFL